MWSRKKKQQESVGIEPSALTQQKAQIAKSILEEKYGQQKLVKEAKKRDEEYQRM